METIELSKPEIEIAGAALEYYERLIRNRLFRAIMLRRESTAWWDMQLRIVASLKQKLVY